MLILQFGTLDCHVEDYRIGNLLNELNMELELPSHANSKTVDRSRDPNVDLFSINLDSGLRYVTWKGRFPVSKEIAMMASNL